MVAGFSSGVFSVGVPFLGLVVVTVCGFGGCLTGGSLGSMCGCPISQSSVG